jgi:hypothetical protein
MSQNDWYPALSQHISGAKTDDQELEHEMAHATFPELMHQTYSIP